MVIEETDYIGRARERLGKTEAKPSEGTDYISRARERLGKVQPSSFIRKAAAYAVPVAKEFIKGGARDLLQTAQTPITEDIKYAVPQGVKQKAEKLKTIFKEQIEPELVRYYPQAYGIGESLMDTATGMTSPLNLSLILTSLYKSLPANVSRIAAGGFGTFMASEIPKDIEAYNKAMDSGDEVAKWRTGTNVATKALFALVGLKEGLKKTKGIEAREREMIPEEKTYFEKAAKRAEQKELKQGIREELKRGLEPLPEKIKEAGERSLFEREVEKLPPEGTLPKAQPPALPKLNELQEMALKEAMGEKFGAVKKMPSEAGASTIPAEIADAILEIGRRSKDFQEFATKVIESPKFYEAFKHLEYGQKMDYLNKLYEKALKTPPPKPEEKFAGNIRLIGEGGEGKFSPETQEAIKKLTEEGIGAIKFPKVTDEQILKAAQEMPKESSLAKQILGKPPEEIAKIVVRTKLNAAETIRDSLKEDFKSFGSELAKLFSGFRTQEVSKMAYATGRALAAQKIRVLSEVERKELGKLFDKKIDQIAKNPDLNNYGKGFLIHEYKRLKNNVMQNPNYWDKQYEVFQSGVLAHLLSHFNNMVSNTTFGAMKPVEKAFSVVADEFRWLFTGKREHYWGEIPYQIKGAYMAMSPFIKFAIAKGSKFEETGGAIGGKWGKFIRAPRDLMGFEDNPFKRVAGFAETWGSAYAQATKEGLKGDSFDKRVAELKGLKKVGEKWVLEPNEAIAERVTKEQLSRTYQDELGAFGEALASFRAAVPGVRYILAFLRTPIAFFEKTYLRAPLGAVKIGYRTKQAITGERPYTQFESSEDLGNLMLGSMIWAATAWAYENEFMTGGAPKNEGEKAVWYDRGNVPYSFQVGDRKIPLRYLGVYGDSAEMMIRLIEGYKEKDEDIPINRAIHAVGSLASVQTKKSFVSGIVMFGNMLADPERYGEEFISRLGGGLLPYSGAARFVTEQMDKTIREPQSALDRIYKNLPIPPLYESVKPKLDSFGKPVQREENFIDRFLRLGVKSDDPVIIELYRLKFPMPREPITAYGEKLDERQKYDTMEKFSETIRKELKSEMASAYYANMNDKDKYDSLKEVVKRVMDDAKAEVVEEWAKEMKQQRKEQEQEGY